MILIDSHVHAYPTAELGEDWQRMMAHEPKRSGQIDELAASMGEAGVERAVVLLWTRGWERHELLLAEGVPDAEARRTVRGEIDALNRWGCELGARDPRFVPYVGIDVRFIPADEIAAELDALVALGAKGVKLIPPAMRLYANDPLLTPVYERCSELGLPIVSQSGSGGGAPPSPGADHYGSPRFWDDVLGTFSELTVTLAHLGHGYEDDLVELAARRPRLHSDTSLRLSGLGREGRSTPEELVSLIRRIGVERVVFGTNYPFVELGRYRDVFESLPLEDDERQLIGHDNAVRLLDRA
jgi:hypothetical protein